MSVSIPEITINEIVDNQNIIPDLNNIKSFAVIPANTFEANVVKVINNIEDLKNKIPLTDSNEKYWWNIHNYLSYENIDGIYIYRPLNKSYKNYGIQLNNSSLQKNINKENIYNKEVAQSLLFSSLDDNGVIMQVFNKYVSSNNDIAVRFSTNEEDFNNNSISFDEIHNVRNINVAEYYEDLSQDLNNSYILKTKEIEVVKNSSIVNSKTFLTLDGNHTYIQENDYIIANTTIRNKKTIEDIYFVENYRVIDKFTGVDVELNTTYFITIEGYADFDNINILKKYNTQTKAYTEYNILSKTFDYESSKYITKLQVSLQSYNAISENDIIYIEHNKTVIQISSSASSISSIEWLKGDWNVFLNSQIADYFIKPKYCYYDFIGSEWVLENIDETEQEYYYNYNDSSVYLKHTNLDFTKDLNLNGIEINKKDKVLLQKFDYSLYSVGNSLYTMNDLFIEKPQWNKKEFALAIFKKNSDGFFNIVEKFILTTDTISENLIFENSNYIYIKFNSSLEDLDIYKDYLSNSIIKIDDFILEDNSSIDYEDISSLDYDLLLNDLISVCKDINFQYFFGFKFYLSGFENYNIASDISENIKEFTTILSLWEETDYLGKTKENILTQLINDIGLNGTGYRKFNKFGSYTALFGNMKLQFDFYRNKNIWLPLIGDIAGMFVANQDNDVSTVGLNILMKNNIRLLFEFRDTESKKIINENCINNILLNSSNKSPVIFDSITSIPDKNIITKELHKRRWLNIIKFWIKQKINNALLKIADEKNINTIRLSIVNYLGNLYKKGVIKNNYSIDTTLRGSSLEMTLNIEFNDIIRKIIINIKTVNNEIIMSENQQ